MFDSLSFLVMIWLHTKVPCSYIVDTCADGAPILNELSIKKLVLLDCSRYLVLNGGT